MATLIAPSLLAADFTRLGEQVFAFEKGGGDWLHLDVMDGRFVPNISFGPPVIRALRPLTRRPFDVHLMIVEPERHLAAFREAGADRITVHQETCPHLQRTIAAIHELGARAGVALNPSTPVASIEPILGDVDLVLIMSVNPGFGGQQFIPYAVEKIRQVRERADAMKKSVHVEVDGGIDTTTAPLCVRAGADVLVAGTSIFGAKDLGAAISALRRSVNPPLNV